MIKFLNTTFDDDEKEILEEYASKHKQEISVFYSVDTAKINGVDKPSRIIFVGGLYLLEEINVPKEWHMGQLHNGVYDFWGNYGNLKAALYGL